MDNSGVIFEIFKNFLSYLPVLAVTIAGLLFFIFIKIPSAKAKFLSIISFSFLLFSLFISFVFPTLYIRLVLESGGSHEHTNIVFGIFWFVISLLHAIAYAGLIWAIYVASHKSST